MNQELIEILLSIYQIDKSSKTILCSKVPKCMCGYKCSVCPIEFMQTTYGDISHYLKHLIAIRERVNI